MEFKDDLTLEKTSVLFTSLTDNLSSQQML